MVVVLGDRHSNRKVVSRFVACFALHPSEMASCSMPLHPLPSLGQKLYFWFQTLGRGGVSFRQSTRAVVAFELFPASLPEKKLKHVRMTDG